MSLPKKNTRPIDINGHKLRWVVKEKQDDPSADLFIQGKGGILTVNIAREIDGFFWLYNGRGENEVGPVTPGWVREIVLLAINKGWNPEENASFNCKLEHEGLISTD